LATKGNGAFINPYNFNLFARIRDNGVKEKDMPQVKVKE
jgi:hypothetical protein|tara:strand:- start:1211 stop:1327 length:117 start_codon:yes stop_codon:yes gene_type:complete